MRTSLAKQCKALTPQFAVVSDGLLRTDVVTPAAPDAALHIDIRRLTFNVDRLCWTFLSAHAAARTAIPVNPWHSSISFQTGNVPIPL